MEWKRAVIDYLATQRLTIHETAAQVQPVATGIPWLGFVVYPDHRRLKRRQGVAFQRRLRLLAQCYGDGEITMDEMTASVKGWLNHVRNANTAGLQASILRSVVIPQPARDAL